MKNVPPYSHFCLMLEYCPDTKKQQHIHQTQSQRYYDGRNNNDLYRVDCVFPARPNYLTEFRIRFFDKLNYFLHVLLQAQQASNPRPAVLETAALPAELYAFFTRFYFIFVSLWRVCFRSKGQNFLNSNFSWRFLRFFEVV